MFSFIFDLLIPSIKKFVKNHREVKLRKEQDNRLDELRKEQDNKLTQYLLKSNKLQKQYVLEFDPYLFSRREFLYIDYGSSYNDGKSALEDMVENKVFQLINEEERMYEYSDYPSIYWELKLTEEAIKVINENNLMEKWKIENNK